VLHRSCTLVPRDVTVRNGLPVTTAARALLDVAPTLTERELELSLDDALRRRITTTAQVRDVLARAAGRPGAKALEDLLDREGPPTVTRSEAEEMLLALIRRARLPEPELNARLLGYEVDALWRRERLVVEVDGYEYHRSRSAFEADRAKGATLTAAGYPVLRLTVRQMRDRPLRVVVQVAQALARGGAWRGA
jgi:very-short-patch-repair endonuclease